VAEPWQSRTKHRRRRLLRLGMHWGGPEVTARTRPANDCLPGVQIKVGEADQGRPIKAGRTRQADQGRQTKADHGTVGECVSTV
jgi:hypothetical protein